MNTIDRHIQDRDTLIRLLLAGDRYALAALDRKDDLALLRRIAKAHLDDARPLAIQRALSRGCSQYKVMKALAAELTEVQQVTAASFAAARR